VTCTILIPLIYFSPLKERQREREREREREGGGGESVYTKGEKYIHYVAILLNCSSIFLSTDRRNLRVLPSLGKSIGARVNSQ
jgi:hypothetical protein